MFALHHLRLLLLVVAFGLAGLLAWRVVERQPVAQREAARPPTVERAIPPATDDAIAKARRAIVERVGSSPEFATFVDRLSAAYPADWKRILDAFARRSLATRAIDSPETYVSDTLRALRRDRGNIASKAGPNELSNVFAAQASLLSGLANVDKRLCVDFLLGQVSPAFLEFASRNKSLLSDMASTSLDAMIDGERQRIDRPPPSDADFDMLEGELVKHGLGKPEIGALLDGKLPDPPIADATLCDAGIVYFDALKSLPDDARARLYALAVQSMGKS